MHQILNFTLFEYFSLVQFSQVFPPSEWSLYYLFFHCCIIYALVCFQDLLLHHSWYLSHFMTVIMHNRPMISQSYAEQHINNQRQNELRHFSRNWAFLPFTDLKRGEYSFSSPIQCCAAVWATYRKQQTTRTLNGGSGGRGVDSFVLWSYPIWIQCLNNFVTNCSLCVEVSLMMSFFFIMENCIPFI